MAYKVLLVLVVPITRVSIVERIMNEICYRDFANFKEGERRPVGLYAAMAIGSELTQTTLNTFHTPGVLNELVSEGGKRLHELLNNTTGQNTVWLSFPTALRPPGHMVSMVIGDLLSNPSPAQGESFVCWAPLALQVRWKLEAMELEAKGFGNFVVVSVGPFERRQGEVGQPVRVQYKLADYTKELEAIAPGRDWSEMWNKRWLVESHLWNKFCLQLVRGWPEVQSEVTDGETTRIVLRAGAMPGRWLQELPHTVLESNHASFIVSKYGIEVGRQIILKTLGHILPNVGHCHLKLVADVMCWGGNISSISRYSSRKDPDVLKRISFEEARRNLIHACTNGERDMLRSYSSRIVASKLTESTLDSLGPIQGEPPA